MYLGQARRNGGVLARLDGHAADRQKRQEFHAVSVVPLHDRTDQPTIDAIEGRAADELGLGGCLRSGTRARVWPSAARWTELVGSARARDRAQLAAR